MSTFPSLTGKELIAILERAQFKIVRIKGSHHILQHADGRRTVIPVHTNDVLGKGLIFKDIERY